MFGFLQGGPLPVVNGVISFNPTICRIITPGKPIPFITRRGPPCAKNESSKGMMH